ncbi:hypothetical protein DQ384_26310 [Sphaerisporangium album]|uniref:Uncharacterized protein n=1 Tax=Sphaerisporangium album TaxID=509200 RepID=A0A367FA59_9ACTN|nr:hypothetical protein [Sphaerisporangium album]RCG27234.1 hypothetical protein DQ384_26310 [Sphaerisporangium album]
MSACWCADPGRTEEEMYQCPAGDAGEECLAHDYVAAGGDLGAAFGWLGNYRVPDNRQLREAMRLAAQRGQRRTRAVMALTIIDWKTGLRRSAIRWQDGDPPPVGGCRWCGYHRDDHDLAWLGSCRGFEEPTLKQRQARTRARAHSALARRVRRELGVAR